MTPFELWREGLEWDNEEIIMSNAEKQDKIDKFKRLQDELKQLLTRVPKESTGWFYQKAHEYKKCVKESDKFIKLKPTDDDKARIRLENHLTNLKKYY